MTVFRITQVATWATLWIGSARDSHAALDAMARAAGFCDRSRIPTHLRAGGLHIEGVEA